MPLEVHEQDKNESAKSNSYQMNKNTYPVQIIDSSGLELIYSNQSSEGEITNNFNESISINDEKSPSLYTELTTEQRNQKLYTIISEINKGGLYLGIFDMSL